MVNRCSIAYRAILVCRLAPAILLSLSPTSLAVPKTISFEHLSIDNGLSGRMVSCMLQDSIGYLWFGTFGGLDRYDGHTITSYRHDPDDPASLTNSGIIALCEDRSGNIWVGTAEGLDKLDRSTGTFTHHIHDPRDAGSLSNNVVRTLCLDRHGFLWIGTDDGLDRYNPESATFTCLRHDERNPHSLGSNEVRFLYEDRFGVIWVGTGALEETSRGLDKFDAEKLTFTHYRHTPGDPKSIAHDAVNAMYEDNSGILWVGTLGGLDKFDRTTEVFFHHGHVPSDARSVSSDAVSSICGDPTGLLWIGTRNGLNAFDPASGYFTRFLHDERDEQSLSENRITAVLYERSGTLWVSTYLGGVNKLTWPQYGFARYAHLDRTGGALLGDDVQSLAVDGAGTVWFGTPAGLGKFDPTTDRFSRVAPLTDITGMNAGNAGDLWIAARSGLYSLDRHTHILSPLSGLHDSIGRSPPRRVNCVREDRKGTVWAGTLMTLLALNPHLRRVTTLDSVRVPLFIQEDNSGVLWIGTIGEGLFRLDPTTHAVLRISSDLRDSSSLSSKTIYCMHEDRTGTLWFGTRSGLNKYERSNETFSHITEKEGLPSNDVVSILEDEHGALWLGTNRGISKLDLRTGNIRNYDASFGLAGNQFNPRAAARTPDGVMYFGGPNGLTRFHPDSIRVNRIVPPIVITSVKVFEKLVPLGKELRLSHTDNFFSFEFTALSFVSPQGNRYAYTLEGFDREWISSGTRQYAAYTNIDPGEYVFRVRGANNDGQWNESGTSLAVIITPPVWKTWWFTIVFWLTAAGVVVGTVRYIEISRLRKKLRAFEQERALEQERARISGDLHDELASNLTSIATFSRIVADEVQPGENESTHRTQLLERISSLSKESVDSIRDIIWAIDQKTETLAGLVQRLQDSTVVACRALGIRFRFDGTAPDTWPAANLPPDMRRHLWLILKEAVNNAIKHSGCTELSLSVECKGREVKVVLKDNGSGFDQLTVAKGKGLETMKMRAKKVDAHFQQSSGPDVGTEVTILLKMNE